MNPTPPATPRATFATAVATMPLIAILRGLPRADAVAVGRALVGQGVTLIEVPLNSPQPLNSIAALAEALTGTGLGLGPAALVGAGTVLTRQQVREVHAAGGQLIVAPNFNPEVVAEALRLGLVCLPGVMTPSEAFAALAAGVDGLKLFPAEVITPAALKALRAVLPADALLFPVGGITPATMAAYRAAGASGFGLGSALYRPGLSAAEVEVNAAGFVKAWRGGGG